jgi:hypothetical protein
MWMNDLKEGPGRFVFKTKRQYYEGEWANGLPKFGTLSDFPVVQGIESRKFPIPELLLRDVEGVLREQHGIVTKEREGRELESAM